MGHGIGVNLNYENASHVIGNRVFANTVGVLVENNLNEIEQNLITRSRDAGIVVLPVRYGTGGVNRIEGNHVARSGGHGIDAESVDTALGLNIADHNGGLGIKAVPGVTDLGGNWAFGNRAVAAAPKLKSTNGSTYTGWCRSTDPTASAIRA